MTVAIHPADVVFVVQHPVDGARAPAGASGGGEMRRLGQSERNLPDAEALVNVPPKYLTHDLRLLLRDLDVRGNAIAARDAPVAVGHFPEDHLTLTCAKEFAPPVSLRDLHAL